MEKPRSSCLKFAAKIRAQLDGEIKRARFPNLFRFLFIFLPTPVFFFGNRARVLRGLPLNSAAARVRRAAAEFQVGDTCNTSAARNSASASDSVLRGAVSPDFQRFS